jgi:hypothetical protein
MAVHVELRDLQREQDDIEDGTRIFWDGSVKIKTLTPKGDMGWYVLARPVQGAKLSFRRYFNANPDGNYLRVPGMREAITIRDEMLTAMVESRVQRQLGNDLRNR